MPRVVLATALASLVVLCSAVSEAAPPGFDAATERVREIIRKDGGDSKWGADPPVEGDRALASDCVLRLGRDEDRSCPPAPLALVDCATWSMPAEAVRAARLPFA